MDYKFRVQLCGVRVVVGYMEVHTLHKEAL